MQERTANGHTANTGRGQRLVHGGIMVQLVEDFLLFIRRCMLKGTSFFSENGKKRTWDERATDIYGTEKPHRNVTSAYFNFLLVCLAVRDKRYVRSPM